VWALCIVQGAFSVAPCQTLIVTIRSFHIIADGWCWWCARLPQEKDAQRMFLQARFLAPDAAKPLVEQVASRPASQPVAKGLNKFGAVKIVNDVLGS
jgi:hypothetical protein